MGSTKFTAGSVNWRGVLEENSRRTKWVMLTFLVIYVGLGCFVDMLIVMNQYPQLTVNQAYQLLIHFEIFPYASVSMLAVAVLAIFITIKFNDKIMLMGTDSKEITSESAESLQEKQLYNVIEEMKVAAGMRYMPKVYIIEANYMNAFASGFSDKSAMVAITRGLMNKLNRQELQAVMAHELSHIRHQDMKLTMMVAILSNLMLMVVDVVFYNLIYGGERSSDDGRGNILIPIIILLRYVLPLTTVLLMLYLSRTREYMADSGAVELMRENESLASALIKISQDHEANQDTYASEYGQTKHEQFRSAAYIFDPKALDHAKSIVNLFSTHPSLEDRLKAMGCELDTK